jgi:hypothetical protein
MFPIPNIFLSSSSNMFDKSDQPAKKTPACKTLDFQDGEEFYCGLPDKYVVTTHQIIHCHNSKDHTINMTLYIFMKDMFAVTLS